jgi:hypothetical protein
VKAVTARWSSSLPQKELAEFFRATSAEIFDTTARRVLGAVPKPGGSTGKAHFFTPEKSDSPFAQYDEQHVFSVGVQAPQGGFVNAAVAMAIHMYAFDYGSVRRVEFAAPYGFQTASKSKAVVHLQRYGRALTAIDPQAREEH